MPNFFPIEIQQCNFNGNNDMEDFMRHIDEWNDFSGVGFRFIIALRGLELRLVVAGLEPHGQPSAHASERVARVARGVPGALSGVGVDADAAVLS